METNVPGLCKEGCLKATNRPTAPDPDLAMPPLPEALCSNQILWETRGPGQLELALQLVLILRPKGEPSRRLALLWLPGGPRDLMAMPAPGKPLKLPGAAVLVRIETYQAASSKQTPVGSLGSLAQGQAPPDWGTSCYFPSFESGLPSSPPAPPAQVLGS